MKHTGTVFLSRTPPQATHAACGAFQLQLLLYDRLGPHRVEPWRVTWTGNAAQRFWNESKARLVPGAALVVELDRAQVHTLHCRPPRSEVHAHMVCAALVPPRSGEEAHG
ncbi:hypothetical protein HMPREF9702_03450 [Delftia acidovorans CCUG 15835]|nr:hypothetical protein HMPREF9702_03450 [Delftia acidovorans CCUG 15835]